MAIIYKITNIITNKIYVGKTTKTVTERFNGHVSSSKGGSNTYLHKSIRKYGKDNFTIDIITECDNEKVDELEKYWINELDSFCNGYNLTKGGEGGDTSNSPNFKISMSNRPSVAGENNPMYGKDSAMKGKSHTEETKEKMRQKRISAWRDQNSNHHKCPNINGENNPMYGKFPANSIKVEVLGNFYNSIAEAQRTTGLKLSVIKK